MTRDYGNEIDELKGQMDQLLLKIDKLTGTKNRIHFNIEDQVETNENQGTIFYSGHLRNEKDHFLWEPQERNFSQLLNLDSEKVAKILSALGHKQRLDILRAVLRGPLNGTELVDQLNMGTTGQLYHHIKALLGADLLTQEERGGKYRISKERTLPFLLLLAAVSDLMDTSDYLDMSEVRTHVDTYLGSASESGHDVHLLLWAIIENSILEHKAGYCSDISIYTHSDGSITVSDNGRGIPVSILPKSEKTTVQSVLTEINRPGYTYFVKGGEKGISIAVVNALSQKLHVEIRREGTVYRQEYSNGIPQTGLMIVGTTKETGTSVTVKPLPEIFATAISRDKISNHIKEIQEEYPDLNISFDDGNVND
ncbi:hypothetical protein Back11_33960 [Paenibacillus baekrokdamisoli]|uniref:DNA topoisomerase (ATP-hydrolyzing) n=1 Tax=Paenibacillus baekrokdamisoli TaxID=1712516 RepID=A0A3G9J8C8_9BACL|nr:ATP-binding protein [Paenibacillus baekrokdamisoli]MBB3073378.1 DNA gyrase subunit B [Paenibacillus baekrokdamisoli]BBH22051.1 hypothetical protein Back11_33960 [Paenibacillus baekrokdamisoli]